MPGDPNLLIALGRVLFTQESRKSNKEKRSWTALEKVLEQGRHADPGSVDLIKLQIPYLEATGRLDKAAELLEAATDPQHHPRNPDLWTLRAEVLRRLGRKEQALEVLERGTAAVGEQALLRMAQAQVLISLGREKAAYDTLTQGVRIVPADQRPMILKAVGDLHRRLNDPAAARKAYAEWAKLAPKDPQPHLMILELALAADDGRAIKEEVAALDAIGGVSRPMAEALVLLRDSPGDDKDARAKRLDEAEAKVRKVIEVAPGLPIGYRLLGRLMEQRGDVDKALEAYRQAREKNGGPDVLRDLFVLLARQKRFDELRRLRAELHTGELTPDLEQVAAGIALATGAKDVAFDMMQQVVRGDPQGLDTRLWQVNVLNALGKPEEAEKILQGLIQQRPEALDPRIALMMLQLNQKQPLEAAKTVEQIRTQAKTERPEFVWAGCYAILGNLAEAGKYYKASLQKWPNDQDVRQRVVAFFRGSGQVDEAEVTLRQILKAEPNHAWAKRELAQILSARRNDAAAWNEALKLIGTEPAGTDTAEDRLVRATVLARSPDPDRQRDAIRILDGLAADSPGAIAALAHELLARIYTDSNQLDKAREHAEKVANRFSDPNAIAFYIDLLLRAKQVDEAERQLDRLAKLEPDSPRVLALRVAAMQAQGRAKEAASWLETTYEAHRKAPDGELLGRKAIDLLVGLGQPEAAERVGRGLAEDWPKSAWAVASVLARRGQLEEALKYCQKAAAAGNAVEAGTAAALLITSQTLGADAQARLAQAVPLLDAALKQQPDNFTLLFSRAGLLRRQGRFDEAAKLYSDLLAKGASNSFVLNNLAWTLSEDLNQPAAGLEKIDAAIQATGPSPSLLDTRGVILTRLGRYDDAVKDLEAATQKTHSASQHYHLARAYHKAGRAEESRKNLDRAKQAGLVPAQLEPGERAEMQKLMKP
jgi:tetratricopeptide (TPR) repeat protein